MRTLSIPYIPRLDERPTWETVEPILDQYAAKAPIATVNWPEYPERPEAMALIASSAQSLFLKFDVTERGVRGTYTDDGSPVYQDSCVEFFVRHPDGRRYLNFEFNCLGTCDAARRESRELAEPLAPAEYQRIRRQASLGRTPLIIDDEATPSAYRDSSRADGSRPEGPALGPPRQFLQVRRPDQAPPLSLLEPDRIARSQFSLPGIFRRGPALNGASPEPSGTIPDTQRRRPSPRARSLASGEFKISYPFPYPTSSRPRKR